MLAAVALAASAFAGSSGATTRLGARLRRAHAGEAPSTLARAQGSRRHVERAGVARSDGRRDRPVARRPARGPRRATVRARRVVGSGAGRGAADHGRAVGERAEAARRDRLRLRHARRRRTTTQFPAGDVISVDARRSATQVAPDATLTVVLSKGHAPVDRARRVEGMSYTDAVDRADGAAPEGARAARTCSRTTCPPGKVVSTVPPPARPRRSARRCRSSSRTGRSWSRCPTCSGCTLDEAQPRARRRRPRSSRSTARSARGEVVVDQTPEPRAAGAARDHHRRAHLRRRRTNVRSLTPYDAPRPIGPSRGDDHGCTRRTRRDHHRRRPRARAASTRCCSRARAPRSWSTTSAATCTARAATRARRCRPSTTSRRWAARRSSTATTSPTGTARERMVRQAVDTFGDLHVLVNNAGILRDRVIINMTEAEWDAVIAVHLKGHFCPTRHAAAYWREQTKAGKDGATRRSCTRRRRRGCSRIPGQANYGAAKTGIATLSQICAKELVALRRALERDRARAPAPGSPRRRPACRRS